MTFNVVQKNCHNSQCIVILQDSVVADINQLEQIMALVGLTVVTY